MNEPKTLTEAINRIQTALIPLSWTEIIQGRATIQDRRTAGQPKAQLLPMVHVGEGEYLDCRPNDEHASILFFLATEPEQNDFNRAKHSPTHAIRTERAMSLIGWVNLSRLPSFVQDPTGFPELIKVDLKETLKYVSCVIRIGAFLDGPLAAVYKPIVVSELDRKYDRWPYCCFRLELVVQTIET